MFKCSEVDTLESLLLMTMYDHKKGISNHHLNEIVGSLDFPLGIAAVFFVEYVLTCLPVLESDMTPAYWMGQLGLLFTIPVQL